MGVDRQVCFVGAGACARKWRLDWGGEGLDKRRKGGKVEIDCRVAMAMRCDAEMRTADARREEVGG